jgi:hypothetical protein
MEEIIMDVNEAKKTIIREGLGRYNFGDHAVKENEVGIQYDMNVFTVYSTDEKANFRKIETFITENDALDRVIDCLRVNKRIAELSAKRGY